MKQLIKIIFFIYLIIPMACSSSCFTTGDAEDNVNISDDYCNGWGITAGYTETPDMSLSNPNAAFDPYIYVQYKTCLLFWCVNSGSKIALRPGQSHNVSVYTAFARKVIVGINNKGEICNPDASQSNCKKSNAICAYVTYTMDNDNNYKGFDEHRMKCLQIPNTPGPEPACNSMTSSDAPKIIPVSRKEGNTYLTPKIKLMSGNKVKSCDIKGDGTLIYQAILKNETPPYKCSSGTLKNTELPTNELIYTLSSDIGAEKNETFIVGGKTTVNIKFITKLQDICVFVDGNQLDCIPRPPLQEKNITLSFDKNNNKLIFNAIDEYGKSYRQDINISLADDINNGKIKYTKLFGSNGPEVYAAFTGILETKCGNNSVIASINDFWTKGCQTTLTQAISCGGKIFPNTPEGQKLCGSQAQNIITANKCSDTVFVPSNETCQAIYSPKFIDYKDILNSQSIKYQNTNINTKPALCIFGNYNPNDDITAYDKQSMKLIYINKTDRLLFPDTIDMSAANATGIDMFEFDQGILDTYDGTSNGGMLFSPTNLNIQGNKYLWKEKERNGSLFINKETGDTVNMSSITVANIPLGSKALCYTTLP